MEQSPDDALASAREKIVAAARRKETTLHLNRLGLRELPREVFELHWLEVLDIQDNAIESLPAEIGKLGKLDALYCSALLP